MKNEEIAKVVHEANKAYCEAIDDHSQDVWEVTPENIKQSAMEGVEFLRENPDKTPKDMHDNWLAFKKKEGWKFGENKSVMRKTHPCMIDYKDLPEEQKVKDRLFINIVTVLLNA